MKKFLLISGDFVKTGGMDRANYALALHLARLGHELHLVAYRAADDILEYPNVTLHAVKKPLNSYLLGHPVLNRAGRAVARKLGPGYRAIVNGGNCLWNDVNWLHHLNVLDMPVAGGGLVRRIHRKLAYKLYSHDDRAALNVARLIITTCERNKTDLIRWLGTDPEKVHVAYYGTDPETFHPPAPGQKDQLREKLSLPGDRPLFAFVGALGDRRKGFDTLFGAWNQLCKGNGWDPDLVVVGTGSELPAWKERAEAAGIASRIHFLGFRRDAPDIFRACDAHVLPSRYEGYSLVTQEALCTGIPALITEVAGISERFPGPLRHLLIPDANDVQDLAQRLQKVRDELDRPDPALAAFSEQLRSSTWDNMAAQFLEIVAAAEPRATVAV
ncbi:glycosyltransferase family 4 protein [Singulisphaera sp. PoT]|uniref:glycosyltransferase family 4 protein n=1 Tax=Singulisphaera sp. PoT TaxID=3411797 RepID=UPI003BF5B7D6